MSYDIELTRNGEVVELDDKHALTGGTYCLGGTRSAWLNITYNYADFYYKEIDSAKGIRWLYGKTVAECAPVLEKAIKALGTERADDYWESTPGNAGAALLDLLELGKLAGSDVIFQGD